jgi:hypothetical protein
MVIMPARATAVLMYADTGTLFVMVMHGTEGTGGKPSQAPKGGVLDVQICKFQMCRFIKNKEALFIQTGLLCFSHLHICTSEICTFAPPLGGWGAFYILSGTSMPSRFIALLITLADEADNCSLNCFDISSSACKIDFSW